MIKKKSDRKIFSIDLFELLNISKMISETKRSYSSNWSMRELAIDWEYAILIEIIVKMLIKIENRKLSL